MTSREANIEKLNYAITTLNEDAADMHGLIERSVDGLERAIAAGDEATSKAETLIEAMAPLSEALAEQNRDSLAILEETRKLAEEQCSAISYEIETLRDTVDIGIEDLRGVIEETLDEMTARTRSVCDELSGSTKEAFEGFERTQGEFAEDFKAKTLKEQEKTRDTLQADLLAFKSSTSLRLDALESEVLEVRNGMKELEAALAGDVATVKKKLFAPVCAGVVLGIVNLAVLIMLLVR